MAALPQPMLARSGHLPDQDGYAYEPKWDGFRAIVRSGSEFRVRSRRRWDMTARLPELAALPVDAVLRCLRFGLACSAEACSSFESSASRTRKSRNGGS